jgi:ADP-heptose:LPS heptosyltransferase
MSEIINFREFNILKEIMPLIKVRSKKIFGKRLVKTGKILVVDTCIIGDFLSTLPALRAFIEKSKENVDIIVSPAVKSLAESVKGVEKIFTAKTSYDSKDGKKKDSLNEDYRLIIILRISPEAYDLIKNLNAEIITCGGVYSKYIFHVLNSVLLKREVKQSRDIIYEIMGLEKPTKTNLDNIFKISKSEIQYIKKIPEMKGKEKKILIHTGSGWKVKSWENKKWIELLKKINNLGNFRFIFVGNDNAEKRSYEYIKDKLNFKIYSLIGKVNLKELMIIMKKSDYFIGIDSGPRNLAHISNLRSISLLSPAAIKNFMPFDKKDIVVERPNRFPINLFNFHFGSKMKDISSDEVFEAFKSLFYSINKKK